ncbi:MAG: replication factor C large subunit [Candidatus Aenigmatarchaeota archaeon]
MPTLLEKYTPQDLSGSLGNSKAIQDVMANLGKKPILLHGGPGVGKTLLSHLTAKKLDYEIFEVNASDHRNKESMESLAQIAKQQSVFGKKRLLLIDEVDGLSRADAGGSSELLKILKDNPCPIILTANNAYDNKLQTIRTYTLIVPFTKVNYLSIAKRMREICSKEGLECDDATLKAIAQRANGSVRSAILDLESLIVEGRLLEAKYLSERDIEDNIFNIIKVILKTKKIEAVKDVMRGLDRQPFDLFWWVEENVCREYSGADLARAIDWLSLADIYRRRISRRQDWILLRYFIDFMTLGIALSKKEIYRKYVPYGFPAYVQKMGKKKANAEEEEKIAQIGGKMHCSKNIVWEELPYLRQFLKV